MMEAWGERTPIIYITGSSSLKRQGSGGFKEMLLPSLKNFGVHEDHIFGNDFIYNNADEVIGFNHDNPLSEENGKVKIVEMLSLKGVVHAIGDGFNDYLLKKSSDIWDTLMVLPEAMNQVTSIDQNTYFLSDQAVYKMTDGVIAPLIKDRFKSGHDLIVNGEVFWIADGDLGLSLIHI